MLTFKKVIAAIFMVLSIIAIIASIIGLFGSWVVKARLETASIGLLLSAESAIGATRQGVARIDGLLDTSTAAVDDVNVRIGELGTKIEENTRIVGKVVDTISVDLVPAIQSAVDSFKQVQANVVAINDAIDAVAAIPMLGFDSTASTITKLQDLEDRMTKLREDVLLVQNEIRTRKTEMIDGKIAGVTDKTNGLLEVLNTTQAELQAADGRLAENALLMADLRQRIPRLFTLITILLNLIILLAIVAFISLFLHSWEYFKCTEEGLSGLMPGDCEKAPATA